MKIENFKNLKIETRDGDESISESQYEAFQELIEKQGNMLEVSDESQIQLKKLKVVSPADFGDQNFFADFSLNVLSMEGTWNFHNRRMGDQLTRPGRLEGFSVGKALEHATSRLKK